MNRVWEKILRTDERLVCSPILLGGNLVLHRHLYQSVPFDPYIPRGEDTDYLINASQLGFCILFDRKLRIKHLHPERTEFYFQEELKWDIERFLYERQKKKRGLGINLDPYPGYFIKWTLYPKAIITSLFLGLDYLWRGEFKRAKDSIANVKMIFCKRGKDILNYLEFRKDWDIMMKQIQPIEISGILQDCWI